MKKTLTTLKVLAWGAAFLALFFFLAAGAYIHIVQKVQTISWERAFLSKTAHDEFLSAMQALEWVWPALGVVHGVFAHSLFKLLKGLPQGCDGMAEKAKQK